MKYCIYFLMALYPLQAMEQDIIDISRSPSALDKLSKKNIHTYQTYSQVDNDLIAQALHECMCPHHNKSYIHKTLSQDLHRIEQSDPDLYNDIVFYTHYRAKKHQDLNSSDSSLKESDHDNFEYPYYKIKQEQNGNLKRAREEARKMTLDIINRRLAEEKSNKKYALIGGMLTTILTAIIGPLITYFTTTCDEGTS